ncbi:MAG: proton-conducting transporter membrane subunit [Nanoarchaeota archaeon]
MIEAFITAGVLAVLVVSMLRSSKKMNLITQLHAIIIVALAGYVLSRPGLPVYLWSRNLFLDAFSAYEILLAGIMFWLAALYARGYNESLINAGELDPKNVRLFYAAFNGLLFSMVLAFSANDLALLWIFAELSTVMSALLIILLNAKENIVAAMKYVFITSIAMVFSFLGLILLFALTRLGDGYGTLKWDLLMQNAGNLPPQLFMVSFSLLFIGFAAKAGLAPFHIWLPAAHSKAPSNVSAILSSSVISVGIYALVRVFSLARQNDGVYPFASGLLIIFGVITVAIAALSMIVRTNLKKLIAFSSVEGMGIMALGIGLGSHVGLYWVLFLIGVHSLVKALMFFSAGIIQRQYHSAKADSIHSLFILQPLPAMGLVIGSLALIGAPLLPLFLPKLFILSQLASRSIVLLFIVLVMLVIAATAFVMFLLRIIVPREKLPARYFVPLSMRSPVIILLVIVLIIGLIIPDSLDKVLERIVGQLGW